MVSARGDLWGLVLAGGDGTRLQQLTRILTGAPIPKQYCRIAGDRSMLETTLARLAPLFPSQRLLTVVNQDHVSFARDQLRTLPIRNVLVQPRNRDTGPGLLFSLLRLRRRDPKATIAVFPSDHYIREDHAFLIHVARALELVRRSPQKVVLLGMTPDRVDPGLGYIALGKPLAGPTTKGAFHVAGFVEKPSPEVARHLIHGGALWNSFVMSFRLETMISLLQQRRPLDFDVIRRLDAAAYESLVPWNFSRDFLAMASDALVALAVNDVGWSDWGTPEAIERTLLGLGFVPPWCTQASAEAVS